MKSRKLVLVVLALVAVVTGAEVITYTLFHRHIHLWHNIDAVKVYPQYTVETLLRDQGGVETTAAVEGTVGEVARQKGSFTLVGATPGLRLSVNYGGSLPVRGDRVVVIGRFHKHTDSTCILDAQEIELR